MKHLVAAPACRGPPIPPHEADRRVPRRKRATLGPAELSSLVYKFFKTEKQEQHLEHTHTLPSPSPASEVTYRVENAALPGPSWEGWGAASSGLPPAHPEDRSAPGGSGSSKATFHPCPDTAAPRRHTARGPSRTPPSSRGPSPLTPCLCAVCPRVTPLTGSRKPGTLHAHPLPPGDQRQPACPTHSVVL